MPRIRLTDEDRERLGCPEFLPWPTLETITVREAIQLQALGYPTPATFAQALQRQDDQGPDFRAWTAMVWLALRRIGVDCDAATLDFQVLMMETLPDEVPVESVVVPGKAPGRARSANSARKSSTSSGTSAARSTSTGSPS